MASVYNVEPKTGLTITFASKTSTVSGKGNAPIG